jgi:hypothetical protein
MAAKCRLVYPGIIIPGAERQGAGDNFVPVKPLKQAWPGRTIEIIAPNNRSRFGILSR